MKIAVYKANDPSAPNFPSSFTVVRKAVLQKTDIANGKNNNKYYAIELHDGSGAFRVFTHYGRTDDLELRGANAGVKECRFFASMSSAEQEYYRIYAEKTGSKKGYKELALASANVGSSAGRGMSSGHIDDETKKRIAKPETSEEAPIAPPVSALPQGIRDLVELLYREATGALTSSSAKVNLTAKGIETPLGILTIGQIEKGEQKLKEIHGLLHSTGGSDLIAMNASGSALADLSSDFYSLIPHKIGRTRSAISAAVIHTLEQIAEKQELLQLMRDMLIVSGDKKDVLVTDDIDSKYTALGCEITQLHESAFQEMRAFVMSRQIRHRITNVSNVYVVKRAEEDTAFDGSVGNIQKLFHGSRARNWMGLLSRGILLPKIVQTLGVSRTDGGWLGNGIYFGDTPCTAYYYTSQASNGARFMAIADVALGKPKDFTSITYGLNEPPAGFDSCHGVRRKAGVSSQFDDDEFVIYRNNRQRLSFLIELR